MPGIALGSLATVARTASTKAWTIVSLPSSSGTYSAGDISEYLRIKIQPASALPYLPAVLSLSLTPSISPNTSTSNLIVNDYAAWGDSSGPIGSNVATNAVVNGTTVNLNLNTSGMVLGTLNSGGYYLWIGYKSKYSSNPTGTITPVLNGNVVVNGGAPTPWAGAGPWSGTAAVAPFTVTSIGNVQFNVTAGTQDIVYLNITSAITTSGIIAGGTSMHIVQSGTDLANYDQVVTAFHNQSVTVKHAVTLSAGAGSVTISASNENDKDAGPTTSLTADANITATVTTADADTLTVGATLSYTTIAPTFPSTPYTPFKGAFMGPFGYNEEEMTTAYIDDVLPVVMQCTDPATGAAMDATGTPTYKVYENITNTAIASGNLAKLDDANTTGLYSVLLTLAAVTGYEVNKGYYVIGFATVNSVAQEGPIGSFVVRAVPATAASNAAAVWGATITEPTDLHPDTYGPLNVLILDWLRNLQFQSGNITRIWGTGKIASDPPLGTQSFSQEEAGYYRLEAEDT